MFLKMALSPGAERVSRVPALGKGAEGSGVFIASEATNNFQEEPRPLVQISTTNETTNRNYQNNGLPTIQTTATSKAPHQETTHANNAQCGEGADAPHPYITLHILCTCSLTNGCGASIVSPSCDLFASTVF